ncbi:hypothetical protein LZC95_20125 [Pendulispora brunnea]|uniref:Uncharacterized protein n=1 Tax=Pendulispora brunnea TaxID=2905690 RepID=A0ABZ2KKP3_9BACT
MQTTPTPNLVPGLEGVATLESGAAFSCARKHDGTIWCWGSAGQAQIGIPEGSSDAGGDNERHPIPRQVAWLRDPRSLAVGSSHACAVLADRTVACWGDNSSGQLGHDPQLDPSCGSGHECNGKPTVVPGLASVREVALGGINSCAVRDDDTVWCWGTNTNGVLGHDPALDGPGSMAFTPTKVAGLSNIAHIAVSGNFACAVGRDDTVWCWGANSYGVLGLADGSTSTHTPVQLSGL